MGEQKTIEQTFQIESPEIEVGLLGTRDKFVSLIEQGMDVEIRPFGENLKVSGQEEDVKLTIDVFRPYFVAKPRNPHSQYRYC